MEISSTKPIKNQTVTSQFSENNQIENKVEKTEEQLKKEEEELKKEVSSFLYLLVTLIIYRVEKQTT